MTTWTRLKSKDSRGIERARRFKTAKDAQRAADKLREKHPEYRVTIVWEPVPGPPWRVDYCEESQ